MRLDYEIKVQVQKAIYAERKADPRRDMAAIKEEVAERLELPFVNGKIQIPDARIDYDLPRETGQDIDQGSRTGHQDIEVLTAAYHAGHLRSKAQAGFRNYTERPRRWSRPMDTTFSYARMRPAEARMTTSIQMRHL